LTFFPLTSILHTLKSTPIVAEASSSGSHCSSVNRNKRLLLPTDEFPKTHSGNKFDIFNKDSPISRSLQLTTPEAIERGMGGGKMTYKAPYWMLLPHASLYSVTKSLVTMTIHDWSGAQNCPDSIYSIPF